MKKVVRSSLASEFPKYTMDQEAETSSELSMTTGLTLCQVERFIRERITEGLWEKVYKISKGRRVPAYRRKQ